MNTLKETKNTDSRSMSITLSKKDLLVYFGTILTDWIYSFDCYVKKIADLERDSLAMAPMSFRMACGLDNPDFNWRYYYYSLMKKHNNNSNLQMKQLEKFLKINGKKFRTKDDADFLQMFSSQMITDTDLDYFYQNLEINYYFKHHKGDMRILARNLFITADIEDCDGWCAEDSLRDFEMLNYEEECLEKLLGEGIMNRVPISIFDVIASNTLHYTDGVEAVVGTFSPSSVGFCWIFNNDFQEAELEENVLVDFNLLVNKVCDNLIAELNFSGAFYTEYLDEKATIIQRFWVRARYNCQYKIARKYINEGIDELKDEIGLVLVD